MSLLIKTAIKDIIFEPNIIGITNQDIFLAENINLINKTNDFYKMMDNEEDIINDYFNSLEELERFDNSNLLESECIYTDFIYQDIPVRIKTINKNEAFGQINNDSNIYISKKNLNNLIVGELVSMNIMYNECGINSWKCISVNKKCNPVLVSKYLMEKNDSIYTEQKYHIPLQDIGYFIGKNGNNLKNIIKSYLLLNKNDIKLLNKCENSEELFKDDFNTWYETANIPSINLKNISNYTELSLYYEIDKDSKSTLKFNPITDFLMKLYY